MPPIRLAGGVAPDVAMPDADASNPVGSRTAEGSRAKVSTGLWQKWLIQFLKAMVTVLEPTRLPSVVRAGEDSDSAEIVHLLHEYMAKGWVYTQKSLDLFDMVSLAYCECPKPLLLPPSLDAEKGPILLYNDGLLEPQEQQAQGPPDIALRLEHCSQRLG